jgi:hypothetical protein
VRGDHHPMFTPQKIAAVPVVWDIPVCLPVLDSLFTSLNAISLSCVSSEKAVPLHEAVQS